MSGHTPRPWLIRKGDEWTYDVVTHHGDLPDGSPNSWNIATINGRRDEAKDNLMLIAAAPDLLEALEAVMDITTKNPEVWDQARAAIAKARGEI